MEGKEGENKSHLKGLWERVDLELASMVCQLVLGAGVCVCACVCACKPVFKSTRYVRGIMRVMRVWVLTMFRPQS